jgi:hypothetical protein
MRSCFDSQVAFGYASVELWQDMVTLHGAPSIMDFIPLREVDDARPLSGLAPHTVVVVPLGEPLDVTAAAELPRDEPGL